MSFFNELSNRLFPKKTNQSTPLATPVVHELIKRSETYLEGYAAWQGSQAQREALGLILEQYHIQSAGNSPTALFTLLLSSSTQGFMLRAWQGLGSTEFSYLLDFLATRVKGVGYSTYTSDRRLLDKEEGVVSIERHYLKPSWRLAAIDGKINQLNGNTTIELHALDNQVQHIKFVCQPYLDAKYHTAAPFADMVYHICRT